MKTVAVSVGIVCVEGELQVKPPFFNKIIDDLSCGGVGTPRHGVSLSSRAVGAVFIVCNSGIVSDLGNP